MSFFTQLLINGIVVGSVYGVAAMGFVLIYKSSRVINFAQGDLLALGAFICYALIVSFKIPFIPALLITCAISFCLGLVLERIILRPMIGESPISIIMLTIGLASMIKGVIYFFWGAGDLAYPMFVTQKPIIIGSIYISPIYIATLVLTALLLGIFGFFFKHSTQGVAMRAVADDQMASQSLGVSVKRVFGVSWAIAALVATIGGIIIALVNGLNAQALSFVGLKVFPVVILGGLDSIMGAIIGGVIIGILENLAMGYLDPLVGGGLGETFPFFVLIIILMIKPYGLFGIVEIERV
ncbi:MAG: branched-chain amino acid ABC transporter permease [Deltaproteobacteria bacterium]|nr:branched-chain amino acid ABC transporter permease [Deltaproteobacteria bacterium]